MATLQVTDWQTIKDFVDSRGKDKLQFVDLPTSYEIVAIDGPFQLELSLPKDPGSPEVSDFENNYKPEGNRKAGEIYLPWDQFKDFVVKKKLAYQEYDAPNEYILFINEGGIRWKTRLFKGNADANDYENNFQSQANTDVQQKVKTDSRKTPFKDEITATKRTFINNKSTVGLSNRRERITTEGSGDAFEDSGVIKLTTGTTENSKAKIQTKKRINYIPGSIVETGIGVIVPSLPTGDQEARWGQFDDSNGWGWGIDSLGIFVFVRRNGTDTKVRQSDWDQDKLDGDGPSRQTLDISKGQIFQSEANWYGLGDILFTIFSSTSESKRKFTDVHDFAEDSKSTVVDPNQPLTSEVFNGSTTSNFELQIFGRQASLIGSTVSDIRNTLETVGPTVVSTDDLTPILSIRKKTTFQGRNNTINADLENIELISSEEAELVVVENPSLTGASWQTPSGINDAETAIEIDKSATDISGGEEIFKTINLGQKGTSKAAFSQQAVDAINLFEQEVVTIAIRRKANKDTEVTALGKIVEFW